MNCTPFFISVDAETDVILEGVKTISSMRDQAEQTEGQRVPITWFVRFQRSWTDSVENHTLEYFSSELNDEYDGFRMLEPVMDDLIERGDEIAWHYHAYHYVHRDDLSHDTRVSNTGADLAVCGKTIRQRYPEIAMRSFRWGWLFVPDNKLLDDLVDLGFDIDASINPKLAGQQVGDFPARYPHPVSTAPYRIKGMNCFPCTNFHIVHDWEVQAHQFGWSNKSPSEAEAFQHILLTRFKEIVSREHIENYRCVTYQTALQNL